MKTYLRFQCPRFDGGVFTSVGCLRDSHEISRFDEEELAQLLRWFRENLPVPAPFARASRHARRRRSWRLICWFKEDRECLRQMWALVWLLRRNDVVVDELTTTHPGYIAYEDRYQVAAEPFSVAR